MLRVGLVVDDSASTEGIVYQLVKRGAVLAEIPFRNVGAGQTEAVEAYELHTPAIVVQPYTPPATLATSSAVHLMIGVASTEQDSLAIDVCLDATIPPTQLTTRIDNLWDDRLVPFEANLRLGKRAPRRQKPVLFDPDATWPAQAQRLIARLTAVASHQILRIDHIGSTSVAGLPAKDLLDIQVVVADLDTAALLAEAGRYAGFVHVPGAWYGTDRYGHKHPEEVLVDADPARPVNINIRPVTAPIWRETVLFRDWLRSHPQGRAEYAALKRSLAARAERDVNDYSDDKMPFISNALTQAEQWATDVLWKP